MKFKVLFPVPYQVTDIYDDNLDVNIVLDNNDVYWGTLYTLKNISKLMKMEHIKHFWATDMLITEDLSLHGINEAIEEVLKKGYLDLAFTKIGLICDVYSDFGWK